MKVFIYFFAFLALIFISGCSNSSIHIRDDNELVISNNKTSIEVKTPVIETKTINMDSVLIDQSIIGVDDKNCIVYEDITTEPMYQFNYSYKRSIDLIFNAYSVEEGKHYGNLTLYRVTLQDKEKTKVNLLALTASKQSLKLIYGFDDKAVSAIEENLEQNNTVVKYALHKTTDRRDHCIKSDWQPKLLILDNLVGKQGGMMKGPGL